MISKYLLNKITWHLTIVLAFISPLTLLNAQFKFETGGIRKIMNTSIFNIQGEIKNVRPCIPNSAIISFESYENRESTQLWWFDSESETMIKHEITIAEEDNATEEIVTRDLDWCPVTIADKCWFSFSCVKEKNEDIYLGNTRDKYYIRLTNRRESDRSAKWAPDGNSILYVSTTTPGNDQQKGNSDVIGITNIKQIIKEYEKWLKYQGYYSKNLVFDKAFTVINEIKVAGTQGSEMDPDWSPDGNYVVYSAETKTAGVTNYELFITGYNIESGGKIKKPLQLTFTPNLNEMKPKWSYDQKGIAYFVTPSGGSPEDEKQASLYYIDIKPDLSSFASNKVSDNIKKDISSIPQWGEDSRSLLFIKGQGTSSSMVLVNLDDNKIIKGRETLNDYTLMKDSNGVVLDELYVLNRSKLSKIYFISYENQDYYISSISLIKDDGKRIEGTKVENKEKTYSWSIGIYFSFDNDNNSKMLAPDFGNTFSLRYMPKQNIIPFGIGIKATLGPYLVIESQQDRVPLSNQWELDCCLSYDFRTTKEIYSVFGEFGICSGIIGSSKALSDLHRSNRPTSGPAIGLGFQIYGTDTISYVMIMRYKAFNDRVSANSNEKLTLLNFQMGINIMI